MLHMIQAMTPAVYILCGIPFSGKSTLAHILATQCGWTHVDVDAIAELLLDSSESDVTEEQWTAAFATSYEQVAKNLAQGQSVVHDATNYGRTARDRVRAIAHKFDSGAHVIYFAVPVEEADQRRITNQAQSQRHQVSDIDFWEVVNSLEPPTADESVLIFDGTLDVATWIKRFICD
jgi:predicted kinase